MTRAKEKKIISLACFSIIMAILTFGLIGCGTLQDASTETKTMVAYEGMGAVLETALPSLKALCNGEVMSAEECEEAKNAYNEAVSIYKFLGDAAIVVVDTGDDSSYRVMSARLMKLLTQLQGYAAASD